jgi:Ni/Co efflux regulator RcnB
MKKLVLALVALAFAFAISSCCDQSYCPGRRQCQEKGHESKYRWDEQEEEEEEERVIEQNQRQIRPGQQHERQHRRW